MFSRGNKKPWLVSSMMTLTMKKKRLSSEPQIGPFCMAIKYILRETIITYPKKKRDQRNCWRWITIRTALDSHHRATIQVSFYCWWWFFKKVDATLAHRFTVSTFFIYPINKKQIIFLSIFIKKYKVYSFQNETCVCVLSSSYRRCNSK